MTTRELILKAVNSYQGRTGKDSFRVGDVFSELRQLGIPYKESTVRTFFVSVMCLNAPDHHAVTYPDFVRVDRGLYRRATEADRDSYGGQTRPNPKSARQTGASRSIRMHERADILVEEFEECLDAFEDAQLFTGPSVYFHRKAIALRQQFDAPSQAVADDEFVDSVYATLTAWGMHRMGPGGAKLTDRIVFRDSLMVAAHQLDDLGQHRLTRLDEAEAKNVAGELWSIISRMEVSASSARLVAGSKALHHLVPLLVPPIDRQYTAQFFYGKAGKQFYMGEATAFAEMYPQLARIAAARLPVLTAEIERPDRYFATGETKVLDNAVVGFVFRQQQVQD